MASNDSISGSGGNNATEYLLSELLAVVKDKIRGDDAQTDWDPITFAFTVPVGVFGILATIFALITIIQGILAASPGRRKSSRHVIGKWAKTRKTVFNWDELRTMTFVKTPILRAETLYQALLQTQKAMLQMETMEKEHTLHGRLRNMVPIVNRRDEGWFPWSKFQISYKKSSKESKEQTATRANWVKLLDYFDLDLIQFKNKDLQVTATDHIPDELRAVYAYTDVRTMIALGAVAEAMSLEPEMGSSYPILIGAEIQIDFRPHPVLGVVAAFSKYGTRQTQQHESQVKTTLLDARMKPWGNIQDNAPTFISRHRVNNSSNTKNKDQTIRRQVMFALKHSNAEVEYVPPASNNQSLGLGAIKFINVIDDEGINGRSHMQHTPKQIIHGTEQHQQLCDGNRNTMCGCQSNWDRSGNHNLLWMFVAKVPSEAPVVFPSSCVAIRKSLTTLCLQSRFWSGERAQQSIKRLYSVPDAPIDWP
ncbi:hypothetical protein BJ166DRAFT_105181 [Pestalotiopsis sp. NC0098]|nr:hypothetical protein BJ166DRAFT_105181 [Pestalotiopsis sp. NC0098]